MLYSSSAISTLYRRPPAWQYAAAFIIVGILHGLVLLVLWVPTDALEESPIPLRMLARTIVLPEIPKQRVPLPTVVPAPVLEQSKVEQPKVELSKVELSKVEQLKIEPPPIPQVVSPKMPASVKKIQQKRPVSMAPRAPVQAPPRPVTPMPVNPKPITTMPVTTMPATTKPTAPPIIETPAEYGAAYLQNPAPDYPMLSRRRREQGTVHLQVWVTSSGRAENVEVVTSSGFERLDAAAMATVKHWRFVPARRGAVAVASSVRVPIVFALN